MLDHPEVERVDPPMRVTRSACGATAALLEDHPLLTVLMSMSGAGVRTASNILLGIDGEIANFRSAAYLAAYAGIAPVTGNSGTWVKGEIRARGGKKRLKNALWQSSFAASTKHPPLIAYYKRKREQGKRHNAAVICLARRRCDVCIASMFVGRVRQCFPGVWASRRRHDERMRPAAPQAVQYRDVPSSISQPISHTPAREPEATCRRETGTSPNPSRPSRTRPSNTLDSDTSRAVFFFFSFTQRIKPHGPYTPKSEEPFKSAV